MNVLAQQAEIIDRVDCMEHWFARMISHPSAYVLPHFADPFGGLFGGM
jgi:hypothetical protein